MTSQVQVTATTPPLETSSSNVDTVIAGVEIADLPLNGRNPLALVELVPGVSNIGNASTPHIAGSRNANNEESLDGMTNILPENNVGNNLTAYTPIVDSVAEVNVLTSVLPAEYGRFSGGVITVTTKSGTNQVHGGAYAFAQNSAFEAKNYFSQGPVPAFYQYQSGGMLGGPIVIPHLYNGKNRSFFFIGFQDQIQSSDSTVIASVPLAAWRTGNFSQLPPLSNGNPGVIYDPYTAQLGSDGFYHRTPYPGDIIPTAELSKVALAAIQYYPLPNTGGPNAFFNNYQATGTQLNPSHQFDIRLDHSFTPNWHTFVKFSHSAGTHTPFLNYGNAASNNDYPGASTAYSFSYDNAITLSPTLVMDLRAGFARSTGGTHPNGGVFNLASLGFPSSFVEAAAKGGLPVFPSLDMNDGYSSIGTGCCLGTHENPSAFDVNPSVVKTIHGHTLTMGGEFRKMFINFQQFVYPSGNFPFTQDWTQAIANDYSGSGGTGNAFASLMLGLADNSGEGSGGSGAENDQMTINESIATASSYFALFIQDDYQMSKNLTVNAGLRWDVDIPRTERHNGLDYWDPNLASPIAGMESGSACLYCGKLTGQMIFAGTSQDSYGRHQGPTQWKDFGPRLGFAWNAVNKTVVRGGFGIVFQPSEMQAAGTTGGAGTDGFSSSTNFNFTFNNQQTIATTLDNPSPSGYNFPEGAAGGPSTFIGQEIQDTYFPSYRNPYSEEGNLTIQRALPGQAVIEAGYIYNHGLFLTSGLNPGIPLSQVNPSYLSLGTQLTSSVPNPFYGIITAPGSPLAQPTVPYDYLLAPYPQYDGVFSYHKADTGSHYNAFTLKFDKRFSNGFSTLVSFTTGKLMDNAAGAVTYLGAVSTTYNNQYNPKAEFGLSAQDVSRTLVVAGVYDLPFGRGRRFLNSENAFTNKLISGWQGNTIVQWDTGTPIVLGAANDESGLLGAPKRPNEAPGNAKLGHPTRAKWFNTSLFSQPAPFTLGNAPITLANVRNPGVVNADISAFKNNYIGPAERYNIQFRVESFNALNHPQFNGPDTGVNDGTFGEITSQANSPRTVQLALKLLF
jgi:hypothetical protein